MTAALAALAPGVTGRDVHAAFNAVIGRRGLTKDSRIGYSIGIGYPPDWGEGHIMSIWDGDQRPLRPGMAFHLVPGFGVLGKYQITISDSVLVTETGCEVLTNFPREPFVA